MRLSLRLSEVLVLSVLATACASYTPDPVPEDPAMLQPPVSQLLTTANSRAAFLPTPGSIDLGAALDANAVATLAVLSNPDLLRLRSLAGISEAQVFAAGLLPDPVFSAGVDHVLSGTDPVDNLAAALGLDLNALRTRAVRQQQVQAQARQVRMDLAWAEWQTAAQARIQAGRIFSLQQITALSEASRTTAAARLQSLLGAVSRGDVAADGLQAALLAVSSTQQQAQQFQRNLLGARQELNRLLGLPPHYALQLSAPEEFAPPPDQAELFAIARQSRADLQALREGYQAQEAAVHKAVLDQFPSFDLSINSSRDTGKNVLLGPSVNFTLPLWNRNQGGIAIERASREALKQEYEVRLFQTRAELAQALSSLALERSVYVRQQAGLDELLRLSQVSQEAAERGDVAQSSAELATEALRDRQLLLLESSMNINELNIGLELLTGIPRTQWQ